MIAETKVSNRKMKILLNPSVRKIMAIGFLKCSIAGGKKKTLFHEKSIANLKL